MYLVGHTKTAMEWCYQCLHSVQYFVCTYTLGPCQKWLDEVGQDREGEDARWSSKDRRWLEQEYCSCSRWSSLISSDQQTLHRVPAATALPSSSGEFSRGFQSE